MAAEKQKGRTLLSLYKTEPPDWDYMQAVKYCTPIHHVILCTVALTNLINVRPFDRRLYHGSAPSRERIRSHQRPSLSHSRGLVYWIHLQGHMRQDRKPV